MKLCTCRYALRQFFKTVPTDGGRTSAKAKWTPGAAVKNMLNTLPCAVPGKSKARCYARPEGLAAVGSRASKLATVEPPHSSSRTTSTYSSQRTANDGSPHAAGQRGSILSALEPYPASEMESKPVTRLVSNPRYAGVL